MLDNDPHGSEDSENASPAQPLQSAADHFGRDLALYTSARIVLLGVLVGLLLITHVPLLVSILVGLILAWPLSLVLFRGLNARLAVALEIRRNHRRQLRAQLRGDENKG